MGFIEEAPVKNGIVYPYKIGLKVMHRKPIGSEKFYRRKNQEIIDATYRVLITHKHSLFNENIVDSYIDYLKEIDLTKKDLRSIDYYINSVINSFLEFMKPPFAT